MERGYRNATRTFATVTAALGAILLGRTLAAGGGPLSVGVVVGVALLVLGVGRAILATRSRAPRRGS